MDIKKIIFIIVLITIILFPFAFSKKEIVIKHKISLPKITLKKAEFKTFNTLLEKKGTFDYLELIDEKKYNVYNLKTIFLEKNSTLISEKTFFNKNYKFWNVQYITPNYTYIAKYGIYNPKTKKAIAYNFKFFNQKIDGEGKKMIYFNQNIYADNIKYILKGFK